MPPTISFSYRKKTVLSSNQWSWINHLRRLHFKAEIRGSFAPRGQGILKNVSRAFARIMLEQQHGAGSALLSALDHEFVTCRVLLHRLHMKSSSGTSITIDDVQYNFFVAFIIILTAIIHYLGCSPSCYQCGVLWLVIMCPLWEGNHIIIWFPPNFPGRIVRGKAFQTIIYIYILYKYLHHVLLFRLNINKTHHWNAFSRLLPTIKKA